MNESPAMSLDECHEMANEYWNEDAKNIFADKNEMLTFLIMTLLSARMDINLFDPNVQRALRNGSPMDALDIIRNLMS